MTIVNNHQGLMDKGALVNAVLMFNYSLVLFDFWMEFFPVIYRQKPV